jgi:hypothetical protein
MTRIAYVLVPRREDYPYAALALGAEALGYRVAWGWTSEPVRPTDLLIVWNLYGLRARIAERFRAGGAPVVIAENGYLEGAEGTQRFALARDWWNGVGGPMPANPEPSRWRALGLDVKPWNPRPGYPVLVIGQRGGNYSPMAMPDDWPTETCRVLAGWGRGVIYAPHPGRPRLPRPDAGAEIAAWHPSLLTRGGAVVTWTSTRTVLGLVEGLPTWFLGPDNVARGQAHTEYTPANRDYPEPDRAPFLASLAWLQWTAHELADGTALGYALAATP